MGELDKASNGYVDPVKSGRWFYRVQAVNLLYTGGRSETVAGYPIPYTLLTPPTIIASINQAAGTEIALSWEEINQAAGYRIYRSREEHGLYSDVSGIVTGTSWVHTGIPGSVWYHKIAAVNPAGEAGPLSRPVNNRTQLAAPGSAMASDGTLVNKVAVLWTSVSGADHYRVYRAASASGVSLCISPQISAASTQFMDETPLPGTGWYRVAAFDSAGNPVSFLCRCRHAQVGSRPDSPQASSPATGQAPMGWRSPAASADAAWYRVARAIRADGDYVFISRPSQIASSSTAVRPPRSFSTRSPHSMPTDSPVCSARPTRATKDFLMSIF